MTAMLSTPSGTLCGAAQAPAEPLATEVKASFLTWARAAAIPLASVDAASDGGDLDSLCMMVRGRPVVALGEPAHGAHEPLELRNRLFFHLVEHCGFSAIILETSFTESRAVYDFVLSGAGSPEDIVRHSFTWGFGEYEENVELIRWIRQRNERMSAVPHGRRVHFYGMDLSGADSDSAFPHAESAVEAVTEYVRATAPEASREVLGKLRPLLASISTGDYARLAERGDLRLTSGLDALDAFLNGHEAALVRASDRSQFDWAARNLAVARQLCTWLSLNSSAPAAGSSMSPDDYKQVNVRDAAMALNALWAARQEGTSGRVLVFAHDAHVMNARSRGGIWSVFREPPRMMGQHLRAALGQSLLIIGTFGARDGAGLPLSAPLEGSVDQTLAALEVPVFLLDLRRGSAAAIAWLDELRPFRANFASQLDVRVGEAFDALVFFDTLTPAHLIADR